MTDDGGFLDKKMLSRTAWRRWGAIALVCAGGLAVYAAVGNVLRDTAVHVVRILGAPPNDLPEPSNGFAFILLYWLAFGLAILIALYCALLDLRFIRLEYAAAQRALLYQSFRDPKHTRKSPPVPKQPSGR
jgi:hypothetical protein